MDTPEGFISAVVLAVIGGGVGVKILEFIADSVKGRTEKRRAEVDKMAAMVTEANLRAATAEGALDDAVRRARVAEEVVVELRMLLLSTGKFSRDQIPDIDGD